MYECGDDVPILMVYQLVVDVTCPEKSINGLQIKVGWSVMCDGRCVYDRGRGSLQYRGRRPVGCIGLS